MLGNQSLIVEELNRLLVKKWKTVEDEQDIKELYELRDALQKLDKLDKKKGA